MTPMPDFDPKSGPNPSLTPFSGQNSLNPAARRLAPTSQVGFARFPTRPPHPPTSAIWVAKLADLQVTSDLVQGAYCLAIRHMEGEERPLDSTVAWVVRVFEVPEGWNEEDNPNPESKARFIFCPVPS